MKNTSYPTLTLCISVRKVSTDLVRFSIKDKDNDRELVRAAYVPFPSRKFKYEGSNCTVLMGGQRIHCSTPIMVEDEIADFVMDYNHRNNPSSLVSIRVGHGRAEKYYDDEIIEPISEALQKHLGF